MARKGFYPDSVKPGIPKLGHKPSGWRKVCFGDVLQVVNREAELEDDIEYQLVNAKRNRGGVVARKKLSGKNILTKTQFYIKEGDFLIANRQIIHGACGVVPKELDSSLVSNEYTVMHSKNGMLLDFLKYFSHTIYFQQTCFQSSVGVDVEKMIFKLREWFKYKIYLPPLPEQKKIAQILATWDEAINRMRKLIDAKKRRKKALMQQLVTGKKRLPGFEKSKSRKSYRFFDLPKDWECPMMKEIARECSKRNTNGSEITVLSCSKHMGFVESSKYFGKKVFSEDTSNYKVIHKHWFGYPSNHIEEGSIGLLLDYDIGIVSPIYTVFKCNDTVIPEYLYAVFKTDTFKHIFAISTNASVDRRGSLRWKVFSLIRVPLPSKEEQIAITSVLKTADEEIKVFENKLSVLETQKRGLMQKLLTGEIRVKT